MTASWGYIPLAGALDSPASWGSTASVRVRTQHAASAVPLRTLAQQTRER